MQSESCLFCMGCTNQIFRKRHENSDSDGSKAAALAMISYNEGFEAACSFAAYARGHPTMRDLCQHIRLRVSKAIDLHNISGMLTIACGLHVAKQPKAPHR